MYLSRVQIDTKNRQKLKNLTHLGAYHNWVEQSFPQEIEMGQRKRHLWRIDHLNGKAYLLVQSEQQPNQKRLEKYGVTGSAETKSYDGYLAQLQNNEVNRFRLVANPVYRDGKTGRIFPHVTVLQQKKWLSERAAKLGFQIINDQFDIVQRDYQILYRKGGRRIKLSRVAFEGLLKIIDLSLFQKALKNGIGKEKAYGMGLMTVIPLER